MFRLITNDITGIGFLVLEFNTIEKNINIIV